jgi:hypothetical protein
MKTTIQAKLLCVAGISGFAALLATAPAQALTEQECSVKYQAAKAANTLNGQKWREFRKTECAADAAAAPAAAAPAPPPAAPKAEAKPAPAPAAAPMPTGNAVFPSAVDPKFASEKPHMQRMHTCAAQWQANKAANTTGGMRWNQKGGGGYYSECNKRLRGA